MQGGRTQKRWYYARLLGTALAVKWMNALSLADLRAWSTHTFMPDFHEAAALWSCRCSWQAEERHARTLAERAFNNVNHERMLAARVEEDSRWVSLAAYDWWHWRPQDRRTTNVQHVPIMILDGSSWIVGAFALVYYFSDLPFLHCILASVHPAISSSRFKKIVKGYVDDFKSRGQSTYLLQTTLHHKNPEMFPARTRKL